MTDFSQVPPPPPRLGAGSPSKPATPSSPMVTPFNPARPLDAVQQVVPSVSFAPVAPVMPPAPPVDTSTMTRKERAAYEKAQKQAAVEEAKQAKLNAKLAKKNKSKGLPEPQLNNMNNGTSSPVAPEPVKKKTSTGKLLLLLVLIGIGAAAYFFQDTVVELYDMVYQLIVPAPGEIQAPSDSFGNEF